MGSRYRHGKTHEVNATPQDNSYPTTADTHPLTAHDIPRKLWLHPAGHDDPLYVPSRPGWSAVHHWFGDWLYTVDNGVMKEPKVYFETAPGKWTDDRNWPEPGAQDVTLELDAGSSAGQPGLLSPWAFGFGRSQSFVDDPGRAADSLVAGLDKADPHRLLYVSVPLRGTSGSRARRRSPSGLPSPGDHLS